MGEADVDVCSEDYHLALYSLCDLFSSNHVATYRSFILPLPTLKKTVNRASKSCDQKGSFLRSGSLPFDQQTQQSYVRVGFGPTTQGILLTFQKLPQKFFHKKLTFCQKLRKNPNSAVVASGGGASCPGGEVPQGHR